MGPKTEERYLTEQDKAAEQRRKDYEANLKKTADVDPGDRTAAHLAHEGALPSDTDGFRTQFDLSDAEAQEYARRVVKGGEDSDTVVGEIRSARTVFKQVYAEVPAGTSHPSADTATLVPPVPPAPEKFDPNAPRSDEPTAAVARMTPAPDDPEALAKAYREDAEALADRVEEQKDAAEGTGNPVIEGVTDDPEAPEPEPEPDKE